MDVPDTRADTLPPLPAEPSLPGFVAEEHIRTGAFYKAQIVRGRLFGNRCIVKDISPMRPLFRWFGRRMIEREAKLLARLEGCPAVPRLLGRVSRDAIAIEYVRSGYLRKAITKTPGRMPRVLAAFEEAVRQLHAHEVVHLDLRQRKNVLVRSDDTVVLIDLESAIDLRRPRLLGRLVGPLLRRIDENALLKWKWKFAAHTLSDAERARHASFERWRRLWLLKKVGRGLRRAGGLLLGRRAAAKPRHLRRSKP